jgi:5'-3' exonuclease
MFSKVLIYDMGSITHWTFWQNKDRELTVNDVISNLLWLRDYHNPNILAFAFDSTISIRKDEIYPDYKVRRKEVMAKYQDDQLKQRLTRVRKLANDLYDILFDFGIPNVFRHDGYEADDIIASLCKTVVKSGMIVTLDSDLYQLITDRIKVYSPVKRKTFTRTDFVDKYGCEPEDWSKIKAICGCDTDGVIGIKGVGIKSAVRYLENTATPRITDMIDTNVELIQRNKRLVKLPLKGTPRYTLSDVRISKKQWIAKCQQYNVSDDGTPLTWPID